MAEQEFTTHNENEQPKRRRTRERKRESKRKEGKSFPWYGKLGVAVVLIGLSLLIGLGVGYSVVGDGQLGDAFSFQTYKHMYDLVFTIK
ncbi:DNA-directed RNA polymerase subunit beta [Ammoniphilus resinae]|uniref:DNA-directed RNA polymerase subunit beta n=1 Tax=Ammoniphilus resinae TaxID=861532 RepID=A0ABS4GX22_9BACL|nr:DNA-directed RNA polymerase subunit beta [Ammoniphilus resinae]MBP1934816.1 hypothetical protein [Ammoniphilus resinae]